VAGLGSLIFCILFTPPFIEFDVFVDILPAASDIEFTFVPLGIAVDGIDTDGAAGKETDETVGTDTVDDNDDPADVTEFVAELAVVDTEDKSVLGAWLVILLIGGNPAGTVEGSVDTWPVTTSILELTVDDGEKWYGLHLETLLAAPLAVPLITPVPVNPLVIPLKFEAADDAAEFKVGVDGIFPTDGNEGADGIGGTDGVAGTVGKVLFADATKASAFGGVGESPDIVDVLGPDKDGAGSLNGVICFG